MSDKNNKKAVDVVHEMLDFRYEKFTLFAMHTDGKTKHELGYMGSGIWVYRVNGEIKSQGSQPFPVLEAYNEGAPEHAKLYKP